MHGGVLSGPLFEVVCMVKSVEWPLFEVVYMVKSVEWAFI